MTLPQISHNPSVVLKAGRQDLMKTLMEVRRHRTSWRDGRSPCDVDAQPFLAARWNARVSGPVLRTYTWLANKATRLLLG